MGLTEFAPAKVNLFLHVTGRRADGFHLLDSLVVFPAVGDRLGMMPADRLSLAIEGPFGAELAAEPQNLVLRAAAGFGAAMGREVNFAFRLHKALPVASGIGGGSADAAAACRLLARAWRCSTPDTLAVALGADVPVCLASRTARMGGIGDVFRPSPRLPGFGLALVNPGVAVSTPAIFRAREGDFSPVAELPEAWDDAAAMAADLAGLRNDLEPPALAMAPSIEVVLAALGAQPGCLLARMSGSGATCFGVFATAEAASEAAAAVNRPGWWSWGGSASVG